MSLKLTETQIDYLKWFRDGHSLSFCTTISSELGKVTYTGGMPFKSDKRALMNLVKYGLLQEQERFDFGIRSSVMTINQKGLSLLDDNHE